MRSITAVRHIIPADGWWMRYTHNPRQGAQYQRLVCWAVCDDADGDPVVTGMFSSPTGALTPCYGLEEFQSYEYDPERKTL